MRYSNDTPQKEVAMFLTNNKYGFKLNVNHSRINELYRRFKAWKGLPQNMPLSDEQRREFENYVMKNNPPKT